MSRRAIITLIFLQVFVFANGWFATFGVLNPHSMLSGAAMQRGFISAFPKFMSSPLADLLLVLPLAWGFAAMRNTRSTTATPASRSLIEVSGCVLLAAIVLLYGLSILFACLSVGYIPFI